jgi:hypothetical protein
MLDDPHSGCPGVGHIVTRRHQKTSPFFALLPDIMSSYCHYNRILFVHVLPRDESLPG